MVMSDGLIRRRRPRFWTAERIQKLRDLWDEGKTLVEIGHHFNKTWRRIAWAREHYELPARRGKYAVYEAPPERPRHAALPSQRPGWPTREQLMAGR